MFENEFPLSEQWVFDGKVKTLRFLSALPTWSRMFSGVTRRKATLSLSGKSVSTLPVWVPSGFHPHRRGRGCWCLKLGHPCLPSSASWPTSGVIWTDRCTLRPAHGERAIEPQELHHSSSSQRYLLICYSSAAPRFGVHTAHLSASLCIP